jgi:cytochrome b561
MTIDYTKTQKIIHWLMAIIIMLDLNVAQKFGGNMELWDRLESRADHATAGMIVTFLFILRIALRYFYGAPKLPSTMPTWQVVSAKLGHYSLYFLMAGLIITGISMASFASDPIIVFGVDLAFAAHNQNTFFIIRGFHEFCTNAIIALIVIHILAALYHQFFAKDDTTLNMLKFWTTKKA